MKVTIVGSGRWASFHAWYSSKIGHNVTVWGLADSPDYISLSTTRKNDYVTLPNSVSFTPDLSAAVDSADIIVISISSQQFRPFCGNMRQTNYLGKPIVLCMKGVEENTGLRLTQVAAECLPNARVAVWVGPGHPQDFVAGIPNCMIISSDDSSLTKLAADTFTGPLIRFYYGSDLIGAEIGAAAKNVVGLAAGMLDGLGMTSLKGVLMARGAREVARLVKALGGEELTVYGVSHLGDYEATLFSRHSHNRMFGEKFVRGEEYGLLAEGVATAGSMLTLAETVGVELPICKAVHSVISGNVSPREALEGLFLRSSKEEFLE